MPISEGSAPSEFSNEALFHRYLAGDLDEETRRAICDSLANEPHGILATMIHDHNERAQNAYTINWEKFFANEHESSEQGDNAQNEREIRKSDLLTYVGGDLNDLPPDTYKLIAQERKRVGSPIWKWFQEFDAKCREPFNVDWKALAELQDEDKEAD